MEIKGIDRLNEFFTEWLHSHDFDIDAEMDNEFSIDLGRNVLHYAPYYDEDNAKVFFEEVQKDFPEIVECDDAILSFFHEIGHAETECEWEDEDWKEYDEFVKKCQDNREYFRHPIEWRATEWGCEYILTHTKEVAELWKNMVKLMTWFYTMNDVEDWE